MGAIGGTGAGGGAGGGPSARLTVVVVAVLSQRDFGAVFSGADAAGTAHRLVVRGGEAAAVGDVVEAAGTWRTDPEHGPQLHCDAADVRRALPGGSLVVRWLQQFPGIGPERASRVAAATRGDLDAAFGGGLPTEDLAALVDPARPFFAARVAAAIQLRWRTLRGEYEAVRWLEAQGVDDAAAGLRVARLHGAETPAVLADNPYVLTTVLPWPTVDRIGLRILRGRPGADDPLRCPRRVVGAVDAALQEFVARGHTALPKDALAEPVRRLLRLSARALPSERIAAVGERNGAVVDAGGLWRPPGCAIMEDELHARFRRMAEGLEPTAVRVPDHAALRRRLLFLEMDRGSVGRLHPEQREAVLRLMRSPLACLVGGAGTGKTTAMRAVTALWESLGGRVELAALSGKAALRLTEGAGRVGPDDRPALTVARLLLGLDLRREGRAYWVRDVDPERPPSPGLELPDLTPRTLLVLDEASMLGLSDVHRVVERMPEGCRLLLVGDPMQLPPIGFGLVFHHLSVQEAISVRIERIHRQTDESGIPEVAAAIREGRVPPLASYRGRGTGVSLVEADDAGLADAVAAVAEDLGGFGANADALRIVAAVNGGRAGAVDVLNARFHEDNRRTRTLSGGGVPPAAVPGWFGQAFAMGDPVVHTENDYAAGLRNGTLGVVVGVDAGRRAVAVDFGGRTLEFRRGALLAIRLAYAITCHRAQGSSARRVIVPLQAAPNVDVSWVYTAVTRAARQAVLVGRREVLETVLRREPAWRRRVTGCDFRIRPAAPPAPADGSGSRNEDRMWVRENGKGGGNGHA